MELLFYSQLTQTTAAIVAVLLMGYEICCSKGKNSTPSEH